VALKLPDPQQQAALVPGAIGVLAGSGALVALAQGSVAGAVLAAAASGLSAVEWRRRGRVTLTGSELDRLREAELALAGAGSTQEAARELAEHAIALLGARSAVVLIEGIGDTVRVAVGPTDAEDVYGSGSRMRLLDDAGLPCGSIAVSARADGRAYSARDERVLDALAERVSTTLHQLSLLTEVSTERRTLADLVGSSSDGIFSVGSDLRVRSWNPAMEAITGVPADRAVGEHVTASFRPVGEDGEPRTGAADPGRAGRPVPGVLLRIAADEDRWLTCSYAPLSDGGYVVIARDETARKKVQDDKDGWIAQVSHELRTPLTPIKGFLHTLSRRDDQLTGEDRRRIYEIMIREEQRLEALVDSLLRSTQLEAGGLVVATAEVAWADRVAEQVALAAQQDPGREVVLTGVGDGAGTVLADDGLATGVLRNLLTNALKYAEGGGPVEVAVHRDGDEIVTSVADHGPGIPRSDRERIFDRFTRLGNHLTRSQQGVGLGLHIARQSVERLGGRIWVDETPGGGATFRFTLPAPATAPAPSPDHRVRRRGGPLSAR